MAGAIGALRQRRAAAVLEIIDALAAHEIVADAAEIDPDMAILVPEQRLELKMLLPVIAAPILFEIGRSEEHTSELQSLMRISYAVFCLKKQKKTSTL